MVDRRQQPAFVFSLGQIDSFRRPALGFTASARATPDRSQPGELVGAGYAFEPSRNPVGIDAATRLAPSGACQLHYLYTSSSPLSIPMIVSISRNEHVRQLLIQMDDVVSPARLGSTIPDRAGRRGIEECQVDQLGHCRMGGLGIAGGDRFIHSLMVGNRVTLKRTDALFEDRRPGDRRANAAAQADQERIARGVEQRGVKILVCLPSASRWRGYAPPLPQPRVASISI